VRPCDYLPALLGSPPTGAEMGGHGWQAGGSKNFICALNEY